VRHLVVAFFLTVLVVSAYANSLQNGFVWDDTQQILRNPDIRPGTPWSHLFTSDVWAFTHPGERSRNNYYRPLQMLTYRVTAQLFGFSARAFHAVSLFFHLLATLLAYAILVQLTRSRALAGTAAALFAVHPIHTEAAAWVSALPELGCAIFFLLAFWLFLLARPVSAAGSVEPPDRWFLRPELWILSWVCFALALLWKEMALTLPIVIAAYLFLCEPGPLPILARLRTAFWVTLPYGAVVAAYLPLRYHALGFLYVSQRKWSLSPLGYVLTVIDLLAKYWWKLLLPLHLNAYYVFDPVRSLGEPRALAAILFLFVAAAAIAYGFRRGPLGSFAVSWVFLTLVPVLNLRGVGRNVFAERYVYIPSLGFCLLIVWLGSKGLSKLPAGFRSWAGASVLTVFLFFYVAQTVRRNADWRDPFTFFSQTLEASPNSPDMENGLAELFRSERSDLDTAEHHYLHAVALAQQQDPPEWDQIDSAEVGLALIYSERGQFDKALDALDRAQAADPADVTVQAARGGVLLQAGRWREAQEILRKDLETNPVDENAWNGLGFIAWQDEHQYEQALSYFQQALRLHSASDSFSSSLHNNLGAVYCEMGRWQEAIAHFQRAIELTPNDPESHTNLGNAFGATGRFAEARAELEKALTLAPDYAPARTSLSNLEEEERRIR
jgi:tetratricopeptide (TPR) repeat protein